MNNVSVVYFRAPWCGVCAGMSPHIIALCKDMNVSLQLVDISKPGPDGEDLGIQYNICGLPTVVVLHNGQEVGRIDSGVTKQEVIDLIKAARED